MAWALGSIGEGSIIEKVFRSGRFFLAKGDHAGGSVFFGEFWFFSTDGEGGSSACDGLVKLSHIPFELGFLCIFLGGSVLLSKGRGGL
jgi:hypothetical protein